MVIVSMWATRISVVVIQVMGEEIVIDPLEIHVALAYVVMGSALAMARALTANVTRVGQESTVTHR